MKLYTAFLCLTLLTACAAPAGPKGPPPSPLPNAGPSHGGHPEPGANPTRSPGPDDAPVQVPGDLHPNTDIALTKYTEADIVRRVENLSPQYGKLSPDGQRMLIRMGRSREVQFKDGQRAITNDADYRLLDLGSATLSPAPLRELSFDEPIEWLDASHLLYTDHPGYGEKEEPVLLRLNPDSRAEETVLNLSGDQAMTKLAIEGQTVYMLRGSELQSRSLSGGLIRSYPGLFPEFYNYVSGIKLMSGARKILIKAEKSWDKYGQLPFKAQSTRPPLFDYYLLDLASGDYDAMPELRDRSETAYDDVVVSPDGKRLLYRRYGEDSLVLDAEGNRLAAIGSLQCDWLDAEHIVALLPAKDGKAAEVRLIKARDGSAVSHMSLSLSGDEPELAAIHDSQVLLLQKQGALKQMIQIDLRGARPLATTPLANYPQDSRLRRINAADEAVPVLALDEVIESRTLYRWDSSAQRLNPLLELWSRPADYKFDLVKDYWSMSYTAD